MRLENPLRFPPRLGIIVTAPTPKKEKREGITMKKRPLSLILTLVMALTLAVPAFAEDKPEPPSRDFSQYLTGEPLKKEELTLGGRPFYEVPLEEAISIIPVLDGTGTHTYVPEVPKRELTEYNSHLVGATTYGSAWNYRIVARQLTGTKTLYSLDYNGGDAVTGKLTRFETEIREIATGDDMAAVLEKLGVSAAGAALVADELSGNQTNFNLNTGETFGSSHDNYHTERPSDAASDMPLVLYRVDNVELRLFFLGGKLADVNMRLIEADDPQPAPAFTDVDEGAYYEDAVKWAVAHEPAVTNGTSDTTFEPETTCTQMQILTFLYRAAQDKGTASADDMALALDWAKQKGIVGEDFDGSKECTRATAMSYIWQAFDKPEADKSEFKDVDAEADYAAAVDWAVANGVTNGTDMEAGEFSPDETCTRGQIVTFLHRAYVEAARLPAG